MSTLVTICVMVLAFLGTLGWMYYLLTVYLARHLAQTDLPSQGHLAIWLGMMIGTPCLASILLGYGCHRATRAWVKPSKTEVAEPA